MRNILWILMVATVLISGCNNDDDVNQAEQDLLGTWTSKEISAEMSIDGKSIIQWFADESGLPESEIEKIIQDLLDENASGLSGTLEFKPDNTYSADFFGSPKETGTWQLANNSETLILTSSDNSSTEMDVVSLSATMLILGFEEMDSNDLNGDGTDENLLLKIKWTLEK